jgi:hypothetical protein
MREREECEKNMKEEIGVAVEFSFGYTEFELSFES